jgi:hypothetical protein
MEQEKRISEAKEWCDNKIKPFEWHGVSGEQVDILKELIDIHYGWPRYTLNFSRDMNRVMKCEL